MKSLFCFVLAQFKGKSALKGKSPVKTKKRPTPVLDDETLQGLGAKCRALYDSLSVRTDKDGLTFGVSMGSVYYSPADDSRDVLLYISLGDIFDLFSRVSIDTSVIQIFMRYF